MGAYRWGGKQISKADNKELEGAIKTMQHWIEHEKENREKIYKADELIKIQETVLKELKRLQEENSKLERANKTYINSIQSITPVLLEDYIEKDKIREKIEELKKYIYTGKNAPQDLLQYRVKTKLQVLKELLEGK